ncbi:MAG: histidine kinase [Saprospiraceae bacterium]|nr:histidine kinase [Saprospiraceae bacterium]
MGGIVWYLLTLVPFLHFMGPWFARAVYLLVLVTLYLMRDLKTARLMALAVVPFAAVVVVSRTVENLIPSLWENTEGFLDSAEAFSVMWMIGFGIYVAIQSSKERKQRNLEEERLRIAEERRNQLEHLVAERTEELMQQKNELEKALDDLKAAQAQLVHSEKMASLGELTAGIAHEIQNPLNFVNNFSELSVELAQELKEALEKPEPDHALVSDLVGDLVQNQEKINHHGKRAANIVSGMLQHSRAGSGKKEPVNINDLADEYLRLSYHGLRAKNKEFNAKMSTNFDPSIGIIEAVPQDLGRVLLNLINNAFYAVTERKSALKNTATNAYEPMVTVSSHKTKDGMVEIRVADNGTGIPPAVAAKIFQPFFTTKPSGQGTGLGLSLAYDIVTKGHGGTLEVQSVEEEGTTFVIRIPIKSVAK